MAFTITFAATGDPIATLARLKEDAQELGVQVDGDDQQGSFSGHGAAGTYSRAENQIKVTVTDKPIFISESMIRNVATQKAPEWGLNVVPS